MGLKGPALRPRCTGSEGLEPKYHSFMHYSFFSLGARWGWLVNATSRPIYHRERHIGVWVLTNAQNLDPIGIRFLDRTTCSASLYRLHYPGPLLQCIQFEVISASQNATDLYWTADPSQFFPLEHIQIFFIRMEVYPALLCIHCNWSNCSFIFGIWTSVVTDFYVGQNNFYLRLYLSSSPSSLSVTSQALIDLLRPRLIVSSKVFQVVFVHSVYNSTLFLASYCCSFL